MSEEQLRKQLYDSFTNRAHVYHLLYEELQATLGPDKAAEVIGRAIFTTAPRRRPSTLPFAPADLEGLRDAFVVGLPDGGAMFARGRPLRRRGAGHQVPPLSAEASLARCRPTGGRGGEPVPDRRPGRSGNV